MSLCSSLHAINNDTGLELDSFAPLATQTLLPNKDGYTIFAQCRSLQAKPATKWKFRLYSSHVLGEKDYLSTKMNVQDFAETYVPNKHNILFRYVGLM
jgi:hypothetical protein